MGAIGLLVLAASVYVVYVLEILKFKRLEPCACAARGPDATEAEIDADVEHAWRRASSTRWPRRPSRLRHSRAEVRLPRTERPQAGADTGSRAPLPGDRGRRAGSMNTRVRHSPHQDRPGLMPAASDVRPRVPATASPGRGAASRADPPETSPVVPELRAVDHHPPTKEFSCIP